MVITVVLPFWIMFFAASGADGMSDFSPVAAVGPNDLRFKVRWLPFIVL